MNKLPAETSLLCVKGEAKETDNIRPANIKIYISWAILYKKLLYMVKKSGVKNGQESIENFSRPIFIYNCGSESRVTL